ncbi:transporter [Clostridia bacterium]|nr:transporter [Clostridia bacterium]
MINAVKTYIGKEKARLTKDAQSLLVAVFRAAVIIGVSYVIISPIVGIFARSLYSDSDVYSPVIYLIPIAPTFERYITAMRVLDYLPTLVRLMGYVLSVTVIQTAVCSLVGYGFARFDIPFKKLFFAMVIITIVIPPQNLILPLYVTFRSFDPLGLVSLFSGGAVNMLKSVTPMYIMSLFGCGLRSGLFIYIYIQFFRGLPKEIEDAALVDGAGRIGTYFKVMLPNAMPAVVTVAIFSIVWQYNDTFYSNVFLMPENVIMGKGISTLAYSVTQMLWTGKGAANVTDPSVATLYSYAGVVLMILPVMLMYAVLQKRFIEGVERSGIVG